MSHVTLKNVVKEFDGVRAVDEVTFSIDSGEVVGFLGPNGAGKTTTMRLITQYLEPDAGRIEIDGISIDESAREARRRIGYLPETNPLYTDMLVSEYLDYMGKLRGMTREQRRARADAVVGQTAIEEVFYRPIDQLSKGYRQRVGLAQAILAEPEILILDEPTEGLDPNQRVEIRNLITHLGRERTVLLSTHVMQEVQRTCSRVVIIHNGRIIADGSVESLVASEARGTRVAVELEAEATEALAALRGLDSVATVEAAAATGSKPPAGRHRFTVSGATGADPRQEIFRLAAARGWGLWELHLEQESLEDLFRELTTSHQEPNG
jgi:ABC-2 type transport system ATP-binding protein